MKELIDTVEAFPEYRYLAVGDLYQVMQPLIYKWIETGVHAEERWSFGTLERGETVMLLGFCLESERIQVGRYGSGQFTYRQHKRLVVLWNERQIVLDVEPFLIYEYISHVGA